MKLSINIGGGSGDGATPISIEELPLSILLVGDFSVGAAPPATLGSAGDLAQMIEAWAPKLSFKVENLLGSGTLELEHTISSLKDFAPQRLIKAQPLLARVGALIVGLYEAERATDTVAEVDRLAREHADLAGLAPLLEACSRAARGQGAESESRPDGKKSAPAAKAASGDAGGAGVDGLLSMVDVPGEAEQRHARARSAISSVVGSIAKGRGKGGKRGALRESVAPVVALFSRQLDLLMHDDVFQQTEAAWRGLRMLVDRTDFRRGARVVVMQCTRDELLTSIEGRIGAFFDEESVPLTCVVAPFLFTDPQRDVDPVRALCELGESMQLPIISSVGAGLFGLDDGSKVSTLAYPTALLQKPEYDAWRELKASESARWLSLAFNRVLLRAPYEVAVEGHRLYEEGVRADRDRLWGDPAWALASLISRSHRRYGWPTEITGSREGRVEDLAVRPYLRESGRRIDYAFEGRLTGELTDELQRCGFAVFSVADNSDSAVLGAAPTVHGEIGERHQAFGYQLLVGRLAQIVAAFRAAAVGLSPDELAKALEQMLWQLIADTGVGARCEVAAGEAEGAPSVEVYVRTGRGVLRGAEVGFAFALGGR